MDTGQSKHRLLIVDGDPKSLRVLEVSLKKAGFGVTTANNGNQALAALAGTAPDLIISDTDLDGTDGFELCRQVKSKPEWAKIPFLFVSGRKSIEDKIRGLELGVDDYLTKPVYIKEIGIRVRTALQRAERERLESRRDTRTKFSGDLADIGVVDLVQTIDLNRKSGIIHIIDREGRRGAVFFRDGRVIDAEVGRLAGTEAMYRLFSWSEGRFEVEFKPIRRRDIIELPTAALLMEGMRRLDEWTRVLETLPGLDKVVELDYRVLADQLAELPDEVNSLLRLCDGSRSLLAVIDDSDFPDLEALTVASNLFSQHILYVREPGGHSEAEPSGELARWLEEGHAFADDIAERDPQKPTNTTTLIGRGSNEAAIFGELRTENDVRTFTGDFAPPSAEAPPPRRKPDQATPQAVPPSKSNTLRMPAPATPSSEPTTPPAKGESKSESSVANASLNTLQPPSPTDGETGSESTDLAGVRRPGALSDTLRGIPIPQEQAAPDPNTDDTGAPIAPTEAEPVPQGPASRSRPTSIEYASGDRKVAEASECQTGARAQGNESQGETRQEAEPSVSASAASSENAMPPPSTESSENPREEIPAPSRPPLRETFILPDRLQPARRRRTAPILFCLGLLVAAGLLVRQLRSGGAEPTHEAKTAVKEPALVADAESHQMAALQPTVLPDASPVLAMGADAKSARKSKAVPEAGKHIDEHVLVESSSASEAVERCRKLGANTRSKPAAIFAACQVANQVDPNATEVMVILAQVEMDRGNTSEARSWAKKAVELKPELADAYVYLGGAEQEAGNLSEAKAAYKKYLELAPNGRYARELRAVLNSL